MSSTHPELQALQTRLTAIQAELDLERRRTSELTSSLESVRDEAMGFRVIAEDSPNMVFINRQGRVVYANRRCSEILGYPQSSFTGSNFDFVSLLAPESIDLAVGNLQQHTAGEEIQPSEYVLLTSEGERVETLITTRLIDYRGSPAILGIVVDISERKRAERALRESEQLYRKLVDTSPDGIAVTDITGRCIAVNQPASDMLGYSYEELKRINVYEALIPEERGPHREILARLIDSTGVHTLRHTVLRRDGSTVILEINMSVLRDEAGNPTGFISAFRDISERIREEDERRRLQEKVERAQRLESLGLLAGGLAHDFNNILVGILGNASLLARDIPVDAPGRESVEQIEVASKRAADLVSQMLAYAGGGLRKQEPVDLVELVEDLSQFLAASLNKNTRIAYRVPNALSLVKGDSAQLQQVVLNLVTNASEALEPTGGEVVVELEEVDSDDPKVQRPVLGDLDAGAHICLTVSDAGAGMDETTLRRMFDPFFTTKLEGRGLGLAAVIGIVRSHCGALTVSSTKERGTTVRVILPAIESTIEQSAGKPTTSLAESTETLRGTILVVDDEAFVRSVAKRSLERFGYEVILANGGAEALEKIASDETRLDAVVLDLTMPDMSGEEVCKELARIRPGLPVILSSGYLGSDVVDRFSSLPFAGFLQKPYSPSAVCDAIKHAMSEADESAV